METKTRKKYNFGELYGKYGIFLLLVAIFLIASLLSRDFLTLYNLSNILKQITVVSILALGMIFVIILGMIDCSQGSQLALIGCATCLVNIATGNIVITILFGILFGAAIGCLNGFIISKFDVPAFIMTLAMTEIARGGALLISGGKTIKGLTSNFSYVGQGYLFGVFPVSVLILLILIVVAYLVLHKSVIGRYVYAVGGNAAAARASGINPNRIIISAYMIEGIMVGIGSFVFMSRMNSGPPASGVGYEFDAITACVVGGASLAGGTGTIIGAIIGSVIVGIINNIQNLMNVNSYWQQVVKGVVILFAVIVDVLSKRSAAKKG